MTEETFKPHPADRIGPPHEQSCGILIHDGTKVFLAHPTGRGNDWNIPKGKLDPGETLLEAAVRETREESGIEAPAEKLNFLGNFAYRKKKKLALFEWIVEELPDPSKCFCESTFDGGTPEMDDFCVVEYSKAVEMVNVNLSKILKEIFKVEH